MASPTDDEALSAFRRTHIGRVLSRAMWTFRAQFAEGIRAAGYEDFRHSDVDVLARLPHVGGARITEIAERAKVSKQAIAKLVRSLEERGYVERQADPDDGRAQRILLTPHGREMLVAAQEVVAEIEQGWAELLSQAGLTRLRRALLHVADVLGEDDYM